MHFCGARFNGDNKTSAFVYAARGGLASVECWIIKAEKLVFSVLMSCEVRGVFFEGVTHPVLSNAIAQSSLS